MCNAAPLTSTPTIQELVHIEYQVEYDICVAQGRGPAEANYYALLRAMRKRDRLLDTIRTTRV